MARVVFDPLAEAHLLHHLDVIVGAHPQPLGLDQLAFLLELGDPRVGLLADLDDRFLHLVRRRDELLRRAYGSVKVFVVCADGLAPRRARKRSFANATQLTAAGVHVEDGDALLTAFGDVEGQGGCRGLKGRTEEEEEKMCPAHLVETWRSTLVWQSNRSPGG